MASFPWTRNVAEPVMFRGGGAPPATPPAWRADAAHAVFRQSNAMLGCGQQRHKIIRNGVALVAEERVSLGHRRPLPGQSGDPTHAHLHAGRLCARLTRFARDSSLEEAGFKPSVPRDTTEFSRGVHVASACFPAHRKSGANENRHQDDARRLPRDRWFESGSLQRAVSRELDAAPGKHIEPLPPLPRQPSTPVF